MINSFLARVACFGRSFLIWSIGALIPWLRVESAGPFIASYDRFFAERETEDYLGGSLLLRELNCIACHAVGEPAREFSDWMPKGGPNLKGAGTRLRREWMEKFLAAPASVKPGGTMPHLLHLVPENERRDAIRSLVAFLSEGVAIEPKVVASGAKPVAHEFWLKGDIERGKALYHQVGCVACHSIDISFLPKKVLPSDLERKIANLDLEPEELEELGLSLPKPIRPIPMSDIGAKYSLRSLTMFLLAPELIRPSGRMPSLKLQPHEAADLAAYLFQRDHPPTSDSFEQSQWEAVEGQPSNDAAWVARGKDYFQKLRCGNCHVLGEVAAVPAPSLNSLDLSSAKGSCLTNGELNPRFEVDEKQRASLRGAIERLQNGQRQSGENRDASQNPALRSGQLSSADRLPLLLAQLNCYACHEREGKGGVGLEQGPFFENHQQLDAGDEGRMPPPLDHVGRKLKVSWLQKVFQGSGDVRPHLQARMPIFAGHAELLTKALVDADGAGLTSAVRSSKDSQHTAAEVEAGRQLLDAGCIQCHALRGESLPGTIGIDLADLGTRIHFDWFAAFLRNPMALKKNTRMPSFFLDGKSSIPDVMEGDVERQVASIWAYLQAKDPPLPSKLEQNRSQFFELVPRDRPIVLRTFMESDSAGTHAIAVGFPERYHFAFDAKEVRLAEMWKGGFLNAHGTWFDRGAPPAVPLGTDRIRFPKNVYREKNTAGNWVPIDGRKIRFMGYRVGQDGLLTFLSMVGDYRIEDRIEAIKSQGFLRSLVISAASSSSTSETEEMRMVLADSVVLSDRQGSYVTQGDLTIEIGDGAEGSEIARVELSELMIPIVENHPGIKVRYRW